MNARALNNTNLILHHQDHFNGSLIQNQHGPLVLNYLTRIDETIHFALQEHPRTCAIRVDLHLPQGGLYSGVVISRFIASLKAKLKADLQKKKKAGKRVYSCTLRYVWIKEQADAHQCHFHVLLLLNKDAYHRIGTFNAIEGNLACRIRDAWSSAIGPVNEYHAGLVHFPENGTYYVNYQNESLIDEYNALFYRASYLAKLDTKNYGDHSRSFGCSQN